MVKLDKKESDLLDRLSDEDVQKFNNYQLTEYLKEHEAEFSKVLKHFGL